MSVAIITGASSGIGAALAIELGGRGWSVGLVARREAELSRVAEAIRTAGGTAAWAVADVLDRRSTAAAVASLEAELGPADLVVANAGGGPKMPVAAWSPEQVLSIMDLNYRGLVHTLDPVLPRMRDEGRGHIAVVSSLTAVRGLPLGGPYCAAKAAQATLMQSLAVELQPRGVAVTTILPGFVDTPIFGPDGADHPTPFMVSAETAARTIADGLARRRRVIRFPRRLSWLLYLVEALPDTVYERVADLVVRRLMP